jgi:hypothetical protein
MTKSRRKPIPSDEAQHRSGRSCHYQRLERAGLYHFDLTVI